MKEQLTLGELRDQLKQCKKSDALVEVEYPHVMRHHAQRKFLDFIGSYRGAFEQAAIETTRFRTMSKAFLQDVIEFIDETIGETRPGYSGGEYVMGDATPVWVSQDGEASGLMVVDVRDEFYRVVLETEIHEDYVTDALEARIGVLERREREIGKLLERIKELLED